MTRPKIGIITISDRASAGTYEDLSGPAIESVVREYLSTDCEYLRVVIPDEVELIVEAVKSFVAADCAMICTTGGTGPSSRDITPEAMVKVLEKELPGFGEQMRRASLDIGVPTAILSRQTAGIVGKSLVINLPGKPGSVRTCLDAVFPAIPYCIELAGGAYLEGNSEVVTVFRPKKK